MPIVYFFQQRLPPRRSGEGGARGVARHFKQLSWGETQHVSDRVLAPNRGACLDRVIGAERDWDTIFYEAPDGVLVVRSGCSNQDVTCE